MPPESNSPPRSVPALGSDVIARIGPQPHPQPPPGSAELAKSVARQESMAQLAAAATGGSRQAFEAIHRRLAGGLMRMLAQRAGPRPELVDDLSQRTWLAVWEAFQKGRYDPAKAAVTTFIYAVGYKMWLQHLRTASRPEQLHPDAGELAGADESSLEFESDLSEVLDTVRMCLRDQGEESVLSEEERGIVRASAAGASDRDIAKQLSIAASTLNARKQTALGKIRRFLAGKGFRSEDDPPRTPGE